MNLLFSCFVAFLMNCSLCAKDLESLGTLFPVVEDNLLHYIQKSAEKTKWDIAAYMQEKIIAYVRNPFPVAGVEKAAADRSFLVDLTYTVPEDIKLPDGTIQMAKGTKINPFDYTSLEENILLFDGSDPAQVAWARKEPKNSTWILVKGSPVQLEEREGRPVYFDQFGIYVKRFAVQNIPARVSQQGKNILVEEVYLP